ncbi:MAG: hypothetical protein EKK55_05225 [Rhodocyclaceae bacterium]|nr:MAG: hypothetical protein EKK55_05225 [Rhodocyclaceae bacterium]
MHRWEEQVAGDPSRHGCGECGGESHDLGALRFYRMPADRTWTLTEPACRPARGTSPGVNPENARRALRVGAAHHGPERQLATGKRCPGCGYGKTVSEGVRSTMDVMELERISEGREVTYTPRGRARRRPASCEPGKP